MPNQNSNRNYCPTRMRSRQENSRDKGGINGLVEQENIAEQQGEKGGENGPGT